MTNEAFEARVVRQADLILVPRPRGGRVFRSLDGTFWPARASPAPHLHRPCCLTAVTALDERARFSQADSTDLAAVVSFRRALSQNERSSLRRFARFAQGLPPRIEVHDRRPGRPPAN